MKRMKWLLVATLTIFVACKKSPYPGFKKTNDGLFYKFHQTNDGAKPGVGDFTSLLIKYSDDAGTVYMDNSSQQPILLPVAENTYPGDIYDALKMMSVGDSATFLIKANDFFVTTTMMGLPQNVKPESMLTFEIKMVDFKTEKQYSDAEAGEVAGYISENNISASPTQSGLIYIETVPGQGPLAVDGNSVKVHYRGTLLDGTVFDSSYDRNQPFEFELGKGMVIKGWDEGIKLMKKGGKAKLVIPSKLAYGSQGMGSIKPFSSLVFDVELIDIK